MQSTGEKVAVSLVLNRFDWLAEHGYTIAEAIERAGREWVEMIPQVARELLDEGGDAMKRQRKVALEAGASLLILAIGITPAGRRGALSTFGEIVRIGTTVTELPRRIVTGFLNLSPGRLDPTCQECI